MTAIALCAQPKLGLIHVATDAATYTPHGRVFGFGAKAFTVPQWPGVVTNTGNAGATPLFGSQLSLLFDSWDAMVIGIEDALPELEWTFDLPSGSDVILAGISELRGPEAYMFRAGEMATPALDDGSPFSPDPLRIVKLLDQMQTPVPHDVVLAANWEGVESDADLDTVVWSLRKILEMQRQTKLPEGITGAIGGFGQLTTVSSTGIAQRILQRWASDAVGSVLVPSPIDWDEWHRANPKPGTVMPNTDGMSKLKRDMLARKAAKGKLRVA